MSMKDEKALYFKTRKSWRSWLEKNHKSKKRIWLGYYKKHTGKASIPYDDAVEEAICFGWIDGQIKRVDDDRFIQRYTPRSPKSLWSPSNIKRAKKMIKEKKMRRKGLKLYEDAMKKGQTAQITSQRLVIPKDLKEALMKNKKAEENFKNFPKSTRLIYVHWVRSAKRDDTRKRRIRKVVERAGKNLKPGMG